MKYAFLILSLILIGCTTPKTEDKEKIRVSGEGKIRIKPNQVIITISVSFTKPKMADAVSETQQTVDSVVKILAGFGNPDNDIKTSSISANKEYDYNGRTQVFVGYQASQSIDFVLNDIQQFTPLTEKLLATKISSISQIQFGHSKADCLFREADLLAYDDALKSAQKLSARAKVKLGKLIFLTNTSGRNNYESDGYVMHEEIATYSKAYGGRGFKISPQVLEFKRNIVSEYELVP